MFKFSSIIGVLCFLLALPMAKGQELIDKVIVKVGSEHILLSDIEEEFAYAKSKDPSLSDDVKCTIVDNLIASKLIIYHAKVDSVEVSDEEVEQNLNYRFDAILQQMNGDEAFFEEYYGSSVEEMKERYRDDQRQKMLAERMQGKLISDVDITPKEVDKFYSKIPADSLPYFKSEMEISEIVMIPKVNSVERQKALDKANDIRSKILSGELKFEDAATKFSSDPGSAARGGNLGFAKRGVYVPEFEAAVFTIAKDEISEPIETQFGFHVIQLIERRGNSVNARHVLIRPEITFDDMALTKKKLDSVRQLLVVDSITFEDAVRKFSNKDLPSYSNGGRVKNDNTNNTFFEADDLDPDTYFAVFDLKPGEYSKTIEITQPNGEKAYRLLRLISKTKPHKASMREDFDKLTGYAKESKKNEYFYTWLKKKRQETYIKVDPMFENCVKGSIPGN
jgi:peptidyl-prolyl cis-trans isomerase SurA